jgi:hypothetical protein
LYLVNWFIIMIFILVIHLDLFLSFPIHHWGRFVVCVSSSWNQYGFNLFTLTSIGFGSNLSKMTKNIVLLGEYNYILYKPNHFLANFPRCVFCVFGN